jgi:hypothetical protein
MLNQITSNCRTSPVADEHDNLPSVPPATKLLIELRQSQDGTSGGAMFAPLLFCVISVIHLSTRDPDSLVWLFFLAPAALFLVLGVNDKRAKREKIMIDLLGELVSHNNQLRRDMAALETLDRQSKDAL